MRYPFFGISPDQYDVGSYPSCAINSSGVVVEVHKTEGPADYLYWWVGQVDGVTLHWTGHDTDRFDKGYNPSVALTDGNVVLEAHDSGGVTLNCYYRIGVVTGNRIDWKEKGKYSGGKDPTVAVNKQGVVVEVHNREVGDPLFWSVGQLTGTKLKWTGHDKNKFADGLNPSIAVNSAGVVVLVHETGKNRLQYWIGQVSGSKINWLRHAEYDNGVTPGVALTEDNYVFEVHQAHNSKTLMQRVGRVNGSTIDWIDVLGTGACSYYFDDGITPQTATNGKVAIQTHSSEVIWTMHADASLVIDRASWMQDHLNVLGTRTLRQIVVPASHDAAMYVGGLAIVGKTQDLTIYSQLVDGVRYFDLRPQYKKKTDEFVLHHGSGILNVEGPKLDDVLDQIAKFFNEGHRELAVLKFSHYEDFNQDAFTKMCDRINKKIGTWFYTGWSASGKRLADTTLNEYLGVRGTALVVCDGSYELPANIRGFYVYRDWEADEPKEAQLTVFDIYSETTDFDVMAYSKEPDKNRPVVPRGQLPKFNQFNGKCQKDSAVPCDLFLLSWTLTPPTAVWPFSRIANKKLVENMDAVGKNPAGQIVNLLYVDYVEYARGTDVAMVRNGLAK
jgi:hypothetical protein